jgi:thiol:disulfide interchange protein
MALQNPIVRVVLTVVMMLVALNLFGIFEITLSGSAMNVAGSAASKEGPTGAFMNGVLATILATPCTAPFLSTALVFAFTQPAFVTILMFSFVGLGLAAPFVILCWQPQWLKFLPKPGPWMEKFKIGMGFPMLIAAVWLFSFTSKGLGPAGPMWFGIFLVMVAFAAWIFGEFVQRGSKRRFAGMAIAALVLTSGYAGILEKKLTWRTPFQHTATAGTIKYSREGIEWHVWTPAAVQEARASGFPVLVDFTADQCLNCKINKSRSLEIASTRAKLKEIQAISFIGDHSNVDPAITKMLRQYNRPGVPLVLVYSPDLSKEPIVLPELFSPKQIHEALDHVASDSESASPHLSKL